MSRFSRGSPNNGNNQSAPEEQKDSISHGGYVAVRLLRERPLDLRRSDHRALAEWKASIINDLGGLTECDTLQLSLIDRCVELMIITSAMALYSEEKGILDKSSGELAPCLRKSYLAYVNSFRHTLVEIYEHGKKQPKKPLNLKDYLEANSEKEEEDGAQKDGETKGRRSYSDQFTGAEEEVGEGAE